MKWQEMALCAIYLALGQITGRVPKGGILANFTQNRVPKGSFATIRQCSLVRTRWWGDGQRCRALTGTVPGTPTTVYPPWAYTTPYTTGTHTPTGTHPRVRITGPDSRGHGGHGVMGPDSRGHGSWVRIHGSWVRIHGVTGPDSRVRIHGGHGSGFTVRIHGSGCTGLVVLARVWWCFYRILAGFDGFCRILADFDGFLANFC